MKEEIVSFKTALLAKERGFGYHYWHDMNHVELWSKTDRSHHVLPTQSLLQCWIREVHNIHIYIEPIWESKEKAKILTEKPQYSPWIIYDFIEFDDEEEYFDTYEQALEVGLQEALKLID